MWLFQKVFLGVLLLTSACLLNAPVTRAQDKATDLYKSKCAACRAPDGSGNTPAGKALKARSLGSPEVRKESDADMTAVIAKGRNKMPAYESKLTAEQIKQLIAYIRQLQEKK